jgi:hypothetical protein
MGVKRKGSRAYDETGSPVQRSFVCFRQLQTCRGLDLGRDGLPDLCTAANPKVTLFP